MEIPTRTSTIEDLEPVRDKEYERVDQRLATVPKDTTGNLSANFVDSQMSFQSLQSELYAFLAEYIEKVTSLQKRISGRKTNEGYDIPKTAVTTALSPRTSQFTNGDSHHAIEDDHPRPPSAENPLVGLHMRNLQAFLAAHVENVRQLQNMGYSPTAYIKEAVPAAPVLQQLNSGDPVPVQPHRDAEIKTNIGMSTILAILIVMHLLLVVTITGSKHRTPYSVSMFFSFMALSALLIATFTARLGFPTEIEPQEKPNMEMKVNFYLQICEQLQNLATALFVISLIITTFFIFVSLAFPFVVLALSGIGALAVFLSVYWEVAITPHNVLYLLKNIRRFRTVVEFVKYHRKPPTNLHFP